MDIDALIKARDELDALIETAQREAERDRLARLELAAVNALALIRKGKWHSSEAQTVAAVKRALREAV